MVNIKNKIMTQEEKAKAYDEAIERAREKSNGLKLDGLFTMIRND